MSHLLTTRNPMSEARRNHIHGPLLGIERPEGELTLRQGASFLIALFGLAVLLIVAFSTPPEAASGAEQRAASAETPTARSVDARAGGNGDS